MTNDSDRYMFVYQEWDMLREKHAAVEERLERVTHQPPSVRSNTFAVQLQEARIDRRLTIARFFWPSEMHVIRE